MVQFLRAFGKAGKIEPDKIKQKLPPILIPEEKILAAYIIVLDVWVFTTKRLIMVEKQNITTRKVLYHSIPYKNIVRFIIGTAGHTDIESSLKIWVAGLSKPLVKEFGRNVDIFEIARILAKPLIK